MSERKQWHIRARVEYEANIVVEAKSADEAKEKFDRGDWFDEQLDGLVNWELRTIKPEPSP